MLFRRTRTHKPHPLRPLPIHHHDKKITSSATTNKQYHHRTYIHSYHYDRIKNQRPLAYLFKSPGVQHLGEARAILGVTAPTSPQELLDASRPSPLDHRPLHTERHGLLELPRVHIVVRLSFVRPPTRTPAQIFIEMGEAFDGARPQSISGGDERKVRIGKYGSSGDTCRICPWGDAPYYTIQSTHL